MQQGNGWHLLSFVPFIRAFHSLSPKGWLQSQGFFVLLFFRAAQGYYVLRKQLQSCEMQQGCGWHVFSHTGQWQSQGHCCAAQSRPCAQMAPAGHGLAKDYPLRLRPNVFALVLPFPVHAYALPALSFGVLTLFLLFLLLALAALTTQVLQYVNLAFCKLGPAAAESLGQVGRRSTACVSFYAVKPCSRPPSCRNPFTPPLSLLYFYIFSAVLSLPRPAHFPLAAALLSLFPHHRLSWPPVS